MRRIEIDSGHGGVAVEIRGRGVLVAVGLILMALEYTQYYRECVSTIIRGGPAGARTWVVVRLEVRGRLGIGVNNEQRDGKIMRKVRESRTVHLSGQ